MNDPSVIQRPRESAALEFAVLREQSQIAGADRDLQQRGLPPATASSAARRLERRVLRRPDPELVLKTWDVQRALAAFQTRLDHSAPILDLGSFACDMLPALKRLGYTDLAGIDLDPAVREMPYADTIDYRVGDLTATPWPDAQFAASAPSASSSTGSPMRRCARR